jgi:hypothetical protein
MAIGVSLRIFFYFLSDNNGTDALARTSLAAEWLRHPTLDPTFGAPWLPLHFWLIGGFALLVRDVDLGGRLLSLTTGLASAWLVWEIARRVYCERAAIFSLLVFVFYTLHVGYSTTSSSEAPYLFFVLTGFLSFLCYQESTKLFWIVLSGLCFTLATAIRYEAWIVAFSVGLLLLTRLGPATRVRYNRVWAILTFGATAGSWSLIWMTYSWLRWKHPLYYVAMNHANVAATLAMFPHSELYRIAVLPGSVALSLSPLAFGAALYACWLSVRKHPGAQITLLIVIVALVQLYQITSGGVMAFARYGITLGTLLSISAGYGLERLSRLRLWTEGSFRMTILALLSFNLVAILGLSEIRWSYSEKFGSISPRIRFQHYVQGVAGALKSRLQPEESVVIDNYNEESNIVEAAAGLRRGDSDRIFFASAAHNNMESDLTAFVFSHHPRYLVYSDRGMLRPFLGLSSSCTASTISVGGIQMKLSCVFSNQVYKLYELYYPGDASDKTESYGRRRTTPTMPKTSPAHG